MDNFKKLHILVIPSWYPRYEGDIGGSFFREQAVALKDYGHDVGIIFPQINSVFSFRNKESNAGISKENDNNVNVYRNKFINFTPRLNRLITKLWLYRGMQLFKRYVSEHGEPDILHAHSLINGGLLAHTINKKYKIPYVLTEHSSFFARGSVKPQTVEKLDKVVNNAKACIAVSQKFRSLLNETFNSKKWIYIPNIVSNNFLANELPTLKSDGHYKYINVCFLNKNKRVDILIKAFAKVHFELKNIKLYIGGNGPEYNNLVDLALKLGVSEQVIFLGKLSRNEVLKHVSSSNAFVLSSEYETFGVVLVEALALGKPVVATKCGGPESIINADVGYLVDKNSVDSLAEGMSQLYKNQSSFKAKKIKDYCKSSFSEAVVIESLNKIYSVALDYNEEK
ncbi:glycosyltransferase [Pseudoalteromonas distincta]|uniref:glycosyltransferase n=1 Tax=Pseudoalteromonas distincta TaxID=77608 RepID=UPI00165FFBB2|nr:glycosyltransferase [Pseudoalteromonas distincta]MBD0412932.1 glycosyltransferase [Pseudoalteromonas distincta]